LLYLALGVVLWLFTYESGLHPTIAGVALGLLIPAVPFQRPRAVSAEAVRTADETEDDPDPPDADAPQWLRLAWLASEAVSPLARVEHVLLPWTSFVIVPLFALANAGVSLTAGTIGDALSSRVTMGVILGLVVGKVVGISAAGWVAVRLGIGLLPTGVRWSHLVGTAVVAGIGFTVSLFITELAFEEPLLQAEAKVGILMASALVPILRGFPAGLLPRSRRQTSPLGTDIKEVACTCWHRKAGRSTPCSGRSRTTCCG
jgi:Na+:H+ antiporter, NhaA family